MNNALMKNIHLSVEGVFLIEYMPIILAALTALFLIIFFVSGIKTRNKDKHHFADKNIDIFKMSKKFAVHKGRDIVGFYVDLFGEPHKEAAIMKAMTPGAIISDISGNQYTVEEFLEWSLYGTYGYIFGDSGRSRYLIFAVRKAKT